jgi:hypothetical protein
MTPEHRYMVAFLAASLKAKRTFTHVHDHDAGHEIAVGGVVRPDVVDVVEGSGRVRYSGKPELVLDHGAGSHIQLALEDGGFGGYDYASEKHFKGVFGAKGAVQLFDHETGRYHDFHVS